MELENGIITAFHFQFAKKIQYILSEKDKRSSTQCVILKIHGLQNLTHPPPSLPQLRENFETKGRDRNLPIKH